MDSYILYLLRWIGRAFHRALPAGQGSTELSNRQIEILLSDLPRPYE